MITCKHRHTGQYCAACKHKQHAYLMQKTECALGREVIASWDDVTVMDSHCPECNSTDISRYELDESFEFQCKHCDEVWLRFMETGERIRVSHDAGWDEVA